MFGFTQRQIFLITVFPVFIAVTIILGSLILRKDPKYWGNRIFCLAFWLHGLGLTFNLIYLFLSDPNLIAILNFISVFSVNMGAIAVLFGVLVIYRGEIEIIQNKLTYFFISVMVIVFLIHGFFPNAIIVDMEYVPKWSTAFGLYELIAYQSIFLASTYFSIKLYIELSPEMKKKLIRLILGGFLVNVTMSFVLINNLDVIPDFGPFLLIQGLTGFVGVILIYFGMIRRE